MDTVKPASFSLSDIWRTVDLQLAL